MPKLPPLLLSLPLLLLQVGCRSDGTAGAAPDAAAPDTAPTVAAAAETEATAEDGASDVRIWVHPTDAARSLILAAGGTGGLEVYGLDGKRVQRIEEVSAAFVELRYGFELEGKATTLVLVHDSTTGSIAPYTVNEATLAVTRLPGEALSVATEVTGLCSFRSPITGKLYALVVTDEGTLQQWAVFSHDGKVRGTLVRTVPLGKGAGFCTADDESGNLYFADETLGVFSMPADPEAETERTVVDLVKPYGRLEAEPKGLALVRNGDSSGRLVAADVGALQYRVYDLEANYLGSAVIGAGASADAVGETEGIAFGALATQAYPAGLLAVTDQENEGGFSNFKLVSWQALAKAAGVPAGNAADPRKVAAASARSVKPRVETPPAESFGDAADDPAIWVHPTEPARSAVIATDKKLGLYVYDLAGQLMQTERVGRVNNVDLRHGFAFSDGAAAVVAADNRTDKSLLFYRFDPRTRRLEQRVAAPIPTGLADPYGVCMYRSAKSGDYFVFVNDGENGHYKQWRLKADGRNVAAEVVREFTVGSIAEGCVADDETGALYVAEENVGLWKYSAEPDGGDARTQIDKIGGANPIKADVEGLAIYTKPGGGGYLVVSNQGANNYALYRREGNHEFVGVFHVVADDERGIDGSSETDGLDVVSAPLGAQYPQGLFVVQDGRNLTPAERQNYKFVSWADIAAAMGL